jgi:hypothetical protein
MRANDVGSIAWILTRVGGWDRPLVASATLFVFLLLSYTANLVFIALPAARATKGRVLPSWLALAGYTLLTQVLDRVSVVVGLAVGTVVPGWWGVQGEFQLVFGLIAGVSTNFMLSGLSVYCASRWLVKTRWKADTKICHRIALRAAFITNPAWGIGLSILY